MKYLLTVLVLLALLVQGCGGGAPPTSTPKRAPTATPTKPRAQAPARIRYKLRKGASFKYDTNSTVSLDFSGLAGAAVNATLGLGVTNTQSVTSVRGETASVHMTFDEVRASLNGRSLPESVTHRAHSALSRLGLDYDLNTKGKASDLDIPASGSSTIPVIPDLTGPFGPSLPSGDVVPGDSWTSTEQPGIGGKPITTKYTFDKWVEQNGMQLARIRATATVPDLYTTTLHLEDAKLQFTYLFDQASGRLVSGKGTVTAGFEPAIDILRKAGSGTARYDINIKVTPTR